MNSQIFPRIECDLATASSYQPVSSPVLPFRVRVADTLKEFEDWPRVDRMGQAQCHVFQCAEFLEIWCETIAPARRTQPVFVAVHDAAERPVLFLALGIERRYGIRVLEFLDGTVSDYTQPVLFPPCMQLDKPAMRRLWQEIRSSLPRFDLALLDKMPADVGGLPNPFLHLGAVPIEAAGHVMSLEGSPEDLERRLPTRTSHRRLRRRLAREMPVSLEIARTPEEAQPLLDHVIETKTRKFDETRVPGFEVPGKLAFYREATRRLPQVRPLNLSAIRAGDTVIATHWGLALGDRFHNLVSGYSDGRWRRYAPGRMLVDDLIRWCHAQGYRSFDFGIGNEAYKDEYCDSTIPLHAATIPVTLRGRFFLGCRAMLARLRELWLWQRLRPYKWVVLRALRRDGQPPKA